MESLLDGIYVINMDTDTARLEQFDSMMTTCNWKYSRHAAVNGKKLKKLKFNNVNQNEREQLQYQLNMKNKYVGGLMFLSDGEIGCLLSHVSLWESIANDPTKNRVAIFEDDARTHLDGNTIQQLLTDFYTYLDNNNIPEPDMLYLGKALDDCMSYEKVWGNVYKSKHPLCLHAYIMTKQGAQKLLKTAPYSKAIDVVPIKAIEKGIINVMVFHPSLFFQDIFGNKSNSRKLTEAINITTECLVFQQHITDETWQYLIVIFIGLLATIILFVLFIWFLP